METGEKFTITGELYPMFSYPTGTLFSERDLKGVFLLASGDDIGRVTGFVKAGPERVSVSFDKIYPHQMILD